MKVDNRVRLLKALEPTTAAVKRNPQEAAKAAGDGAVKLSSEFGGVKPQAPVDNSARVAELRVQVASGTYKPDSSAVAEALVKELGVIR